MRHKDALFAFDVTGLDVERHSEALFDLIRVIVGYSTQVVVELNESRAVVMLVMLVWRCRLVGRVVLVQLLPLPLPLTPVLVQSRTSDIGKTRLLLVSPTVLLNDLSWTRWVRKGYTTLPEAQRVGFESRMKLVLDNVEYICN